MKTFLVLQICSRQFKGSELQVCDIIKLLGEGTRWVFAVRWTIRTSSVWVCVGRSFAECDVVGACGKTDGQRSVQHRLRLHVRALPHSHQVSRVHIYVVSVGHIHKNVAVNETWVGVQSASRNKILSLFCVVSFSVCWVKANCSINTSSETFRKRLVF